MALLNQPRKPRDARQLHRWRAARIGFRRGWAVRAERELGMVWPKSEREWAFCGLYAFTALALAMSSGGRVTRTIAREAGIAAVRDAGYRETRPATQAQRADELLALPRVQRGILDVFARQGVDVDKCGAALAEIVNAPLDEDGVVTAGDKLKGVELFFRITVGFAPSKSASVTANVPVDSFFDETAFAETPPIAPTNQKTRDAAPPRTRTARTVKT